METIRSNSLYEGIRDNKGKTFKPTPFPKFEHRPTKRKCFYVLWVYSNVISVVEFQRFVAKNQQTQRKSLYIVNTINESSSKKWHHLNFKVNFYVQKNQNCSSQETRSSLYVPPILESVSMVGDYLCCNFSTLNIGLTNNLNILRAIVSK